MSGNDFDEADASMDGQLNYFAKESTTSVKMTNQGINSKLFQEFQTFDNFSKELCFCSRTQPI